MINQNDIDDKILHLNELKTEILLNILEAAISNHSVKLVSVTYDVNGYNDEDYYKYLESITINDETYGFSSHGELQTVHVNDEYYYVEEGPPMPKLNYLDIFESVQQKIFQNCNFIETMDRSFTMSYTPETGYQLELGAPEYRD